jgi:hypothetical protein
MSVIRKVPTAIKQRQIILTHHSVLSPKKIIANSTDKTTLDLSTAATLDTSPRDKALK